MKKLISIITAGLFCVSLHAQDTLTAVDAVVSEVTIENSAIIQNYNTQLDSVVNLWYTQKAGALEYPKGKRHRDSTYVPKFSEKEYKQRIEQMNSVVHITYNSKVQAYIDVYANKRRNSVSTMLGLAEYYFPIFEDIFDEYDVPQELKYLAIIESALNPKAKSPMGARGIWQFMPSTAKVYDLKITSYVDERCDPIKSTRAAAAYLKNLHAMFNDWILAIAAYNCGPGNVKKAIARSGGKTDYWLIYNNLPKETRGYVPAYIAAYYVFEHHELHNLYPRKVNMPQLDTVMIKKRKVHFKQIADYLEVPVKEISDVNPQYKAEMVPYSEEGSPLYLPVEIVSPFLRLQDSIYAYKDSLYQNLKPEVEFASSVKNTGAGTSGKSKVYYTVRKGDTYAKIASKYGVSVNSLKSWNHKSSNMLHIGDKLVVYVSAPGRGNYAQTKTTATSTTASKPTTTASSQQKSSTVTKSSSSASYHTVQSGDTLWSISQRYGTTVDDLKSVNGLTSSRLSLGMKLRIP